LRGARKVDVWEERKEESKEVEVLRAWWGMAGYYCELVSGCERLSVDTPCRQTQPLGGECVQKRPFRNAMRAAVAIHGAWGRGQTGALTWQPGRWVASRSSTRVQLCGACRARKCSGQGPIGKLCNTIYEEMTMVHGRRRGALSCRRWRWEGMQSRE
jgi:hypothetical protein